MTRLAEARAEEEALTAEEEALVLMSQVLKFRDNPGQLSYRDTVGTIAIFPGPSQPNRDSWQLCVLVQKHNKMAKQDIHG